jgi:hypothetical protein
MLLRASGAGDAVSAILFLLNRAGNRIDFSQAPNERLFRALTES